MRKGDSKTNKEKAETKMQQTGGAACVLTEPLAALLTDLIQREKKR
jgi:hypothetical protein